MVMESLTKET